MAGAIQNLFHISSNRTPRGEGISFKSGGLLDLPPSLHIPQRPWMRRLPLLALTASLLAAAVGAAESLDDGIAALERGDFVAAAAMFQGPAAKGDALAQYDLGTLYQQGRGVPEDYLEAARWYRLSAAQGNAQAQRNLGAIYRDGLGVPPDPALAQVVAYMWLNLAAGSGAPEAAGYRDALAKRMKPAQIAQAQKLSNDCVQRHFQNCEPKPPVKPPPLAMPAEEP